MIMGLGCACEEQQGTGIKGLGASYTAVCGDQPPAASIQYADWYNCWDAQQSNPTPPITSWIAFDGGGNPVSVIPKTVSTPTVVTPYTAPLPTNKPVMNGTAIVNASVPPVVLPAPVLSKTPTPIINLPSVFVDGQKPVSTTMTPVIGINSTVPVATTATTDYTPYLIVGGLGLLGLLFLK